MNMPERPAPDPAGLQSPERLAASYEQVGAGIVEVDGEGRILHLNRQLCQLTGYSPPELLGRTVFQETLPEDVDRDLQEFRRQLSGEIDRYSIEKRIRRKDGTHFWAEVTSSSIRDSASRFLYAVRVQHDITGRKIAEQALARRMHEQAALFEFSERLQYVTSAQQVHETALDAIGHGLDCQRAAILLFDSADVMRFVAWRGLSDAYRQAVEGHSPWPRDEKDAHPVYFQDVAASDLSDDLKETIAREGIGAVAFIPIQQDGLLVGKFMAYYDAPHCFSDPEVAVALTLARQLGFSLARSKAEDARRAAEQSALQLVSIVEFSDDAIISKDLNGVIQTWNSGAENLFGYTAEEAIGRPVTMLMPADRQNEEPEFWPVCAAANVFITMRPSDSERMGASSIFRSRFLLCMTVRAGSLEPRRSREMSPSAKKPSASSSRASSVCNNCSQLFRRRFTPRMPTAKSPTSMRPPSISRAGRRHWAATNGASPGSSTIRMARRCRTISVRWRWP